MSCRYNLDKYVGVCLQLCTKTVHVYSILDTALLQWPDSVVSIVKPHLPCLDYTVVCFTTQLQPKTVKMAAAQAKCGLTNVFATAQK